MISMFCLFFVIFFSMINSNVRIDFSNLSENNDFVVAILSNNNMGAYDLDSGTYFFSKNMFDLDKLKIISPYKVRYFINKISDFQYSISIYSNKYYQQRNIVVVNSNIVVVNNYYDINDFHSKNELVSNSFDRNYTNVFIEIIDNDYLSHGFYPNSEYYVGRIRERGASSSFSPKKSYKIEFEDDISVFGMDKDDDWVLDSLYVDKSKIRNKLSSDLWNQVNNNQKINNDLNGQFTEIFINNKYEGLYVVKEKIDKKITGVSDYGVLVKSVSHVTEDVKNKFIFEKTSLIQKNADIFLENFEIKNYTLKSLNKFSQNIKNYYVDSSYDSIYKNFYMDNYLNYNIFILFIMGEDNITKNQYLSMENENSKILITPWDMDLTWGLEWGSFSEISENNMNDFNFDYGWIEDNIIKNMDEKTIAALKNRYWELRKNVITMDTINEYLDSYEELLVNSGAASRDSERWYEYDVQFEIEQIREWASRRIEFLDEYFKR